MLGCSQDFMNALKSPIKEFYLKFEFYDANMIYLHEYTKQITENDIGNISIDANRPIRRSFTFTLFNKNNEFVWGEDKLIFIDKRVKLFTGLKIKDGTIDYVQQGVYILSEPVDRHLGEGKSTTVNGQDKMFLYCNGRGCLLNELTLEAGLNIGQAIKILASKVGETLFHFDSTEEILPYNITLEAGSSIYDAITTLSGLGRCDVYYDTFGYLRLKNINLNDFDYNPSVWKFEYNNSEEKFYAGNVRRLEDTIYNHILVLGGSGQTAEQRCELIVTDSDPRWAGSPYTVERIGDRLYRHNGGAPDPFLGGTDPAPALWRAKYSLMQKLSYSEKLSLSLAPHYLLEANDIIEVIDNENSVNGKYLIQSLNIPLKPEVMTCECLKYRKILDSWDFI